MYVDNGLRSQHLADIVRLRAIHHTADVQGSWFCDVDTIWLRKMEFTPSGSGHVFPGTYGQRDALQYKDDKQMLCYWKTHLLRKVDEKLYLGCPWACPSGSSVSADALEEVVDLIAKKKFRGINYKALIKAVHVSIHKHGLMLDVLDPDLFHGLPSFIGHWPFRGGVAGACHGLAVKPLQDLLAQAWAINKSFLSTNFELKGAKQSALAASQPLGQQCFYVKVAGHICVKPPSAGMT